MSRPRLPAGLIASSLPTDSTSTIGFECLDTNEAFGHQTGLNEFVGRKIGDAIPGFGASNPDLLEVLGRVAREGKPENLEAYIKALDMWFSISAFSTESGHWEGEVWDMKKSGEIFTMHLSISAIPDDTGFRRRYAAQFSDITEKKRMEEIVARHASFDSLTGLPNRRLFATAWSRRSRRPTVSG